MEKAADLFLRSRCIRKFEREKIFPVFSRERKGGHMKNILVVDDTKSIRKLLTTCLELDGFAVDSAEDGKQAIDFIMRKQFDLIFLDIKLPIMSGTEVLRRIREKGIMVPVVIITAFGNIKNAIDCTKLGAAYYIQKPFTAKRINTVLQELNILSGGKAKTPVGDVKELISQKKFDGAEKKLKSLLADDPLDAEIYNLLALTSAELDRQEEAGEYRKLYEAIKKR